MSISRQTSSSAAPKPFLLEPPRPLDWRFLMVVKPPTARQPQGKTTQEGAVQAPQSPVHGSRRHLLSAKNVRMSSVDLPDDNEKSLSSASTSPCPSPKPHRLLPTNLYVVLYNFRSRHPDEIDLKAGCIITVTDTSDADWWQVRL
ncbi:hypothetical protein X975_18306, partial [Stegodyphus mimosarum]